MLCKLVKSTFHTYGEDHWPSEESELEYLTDWEDVNYEEAKQVVHFLNDKNLIKRINESYFLLYIPAEPIPTIKSTLKEIIEDQRKEKIKREKQEEDRKREAIKDKTKRDKKKLEQLKRKYENN